MVADGSDFEGLDQCGAFAALKPEEVESIANTVENAARKELFGPSEGDGRSERHCSLKCHARSDTHGGGAPSLSRLVVRSLNTFVRHGCRAVVVQSCKA